MWHRWQVGDIAMSDNRSTAHHADFNCADFHRVMHRITLPVDIPVGPQLPIA